MKFLLRSIAIFFIFLLLACFFYLSFPSKSKIYTHDYGDWDAGTVQHILSSFDHEKILMKVSYKESQKETPLLRINNFLIKGTQNDSAGRFWQFYFKGLKADTVYKLQLLYPNLQANTSAWNITSFPSPKAKVDSLKIAAFTCAGGVETNFFGKEVFLNMPARIALLKSIIRKKPRIIIANGDHIYWDQLSFKLGFVKRLFRYFNNCRYGTLDLNKSMLDRRNEKKFTNIVDAQIANLYGCELREASVYFLSDDHDLGENDEAVENGLTTFPPKEYMLNIAKTTQLLYYPEFLSDSTRPRILPGGVKGSLGLSRSFGSLHYGNLLEINFFDAKRYCTLKNDRAVLTPLSAEKWLQDRSENATAKWLFLAPSSPFGWTAGKWLEWYPDVLNDDNKMEDTGKYLWQKGWWAQHQRIVSNLKLQKQIAVILQGDLHMSALGKIKKSGSLDLLTRPIYVVNTGTLGTGKIGFPSYIRGTNALVPKSLSVQEIIKPIEKNGFTILNISQKKCEISMYAWRPINGVMNISKLKPFYIQNIII